MLAAPKPICAATFGKRYQRLIDRLAYAVNIGVMDVDDDLARRANDPLAQLLRQDLGPLSVAELEARIKALEGEIARTRSVIENAVNHKASAEALFRR